jgi:hypothetical protein
VCAHLAQFVFWKRYWESSGKLQSEFSVAAQGRLQEQANRLHLKLARSFAERHPFRIVLIDGEQLATLMMIRHNVGVRIDETLYLKKVDEDFFWMSKLWITVRKARLLAIARDPGVFLGSF